MSKLEVLNKFFLQWFFIRLTKRQERVITEFKMESVSMIINGEQSIMGRPTYHTNQWFSIMCFVVPLTGWNSNCKFIFGKCKTFQITGKKIVQIGNNY